MSEEIFAIVKTRDGNIRKGKGFSIEELKEANFSVKEALKYGIPVDLRRNTKYEENVLKLKSLDKSKLTEKKIKKLLKPQANRKRVFRALTSAGKKMRGLNKEKLRLTHNHKWKKKRGESK